MSDRLGHIRCSACGHTFSISYSGFYKTHDCGGHGSQHVAGCHACRRDEIVRAAYAVQAEDDRDGISGNVALNLAIDALDDA